MCTLYFVPDEGSAAQQCSLVVAAKEEKVCNKRKQKCIYVRQYKSEYVQIHVRNA